METTNAKATTESEVKVSEAKIVNNELRIDSERVRPYMMKLVEASKLSLHDKFMKYEPKVGTKEARFKEILTFAIQSETLKDFWRPKMDPSFDETGDGICYELGKRPAINKSKNWWEVAAVKIGLQIGTKKQYVAFLGFLIKKLVENGWKVKDAWYAVCIDSKELGHFWNSGGARHKLEVTGSREICGFCDLGNTCKILARNESMEAEGFWYASGYYGCDSKTFPLADFVLIRKWDPNEIIDCSTAWLVYNGNTKSCLRN